ncbi:hypothetical protein D1871_07190 [Nakamurella silvestris]|nr:hypothetical protein D1871_07190 [Nakamurella silvestris]
MSSTGKTPEVNALGITTRQEFADHLNAARSEAGLSIRDLARLSGTPVGTLGGHLSAAHLPTIAQTDTFVRVLAACNITDESTVGEWLAVLDQLRKSRTDRSEFRGAPYPGLESFAPDQSHLFFGREELTEELTARVIGALNGDNSNLLVVIGPSGSGKSSVIRAGLIPALTELRPDIAVARSTPGRTPLPNLTQTLATLPAEGPALCVIDQFEELFTSGAEASVRQEYLSLLTTTAAKEVGTHRRVFMIVLRADFYAAAVSESTLVPALEGAQTVVSGLRPEQLRRAIVEPARRRHTAVDEELVELLLTELAPTGGGTAHDPGALPLLSHALLATWTRSKRGRMTVADYRAAGGIEHSVKQTAEELYGSLTEEQQDLTRRTLLRMVNVETGAAVTRRRVTRRELAGDGVASTAAVSELLDELIAHRLISADADWVEISHEALLTGWPRLQEWVDADRSGLITRRQLTIGAQTWSDHGEDTADLWRGNRLEGAVEFLRSTTRNLDLNQQEIAFIEAGQAEEQRVRAQRRRNTRRLQVLVACAAVLALVASGFAIFGFSSRADALDQKSSADIARNQAQSREIAVQAARLRDTDPTVAAQLSLIAYRIHPTPDATGALLDTSAMVPVTRMVGPVGPVAGAVNPSGGIIATSDPLSGDVTLWDLSDPHRFKALSTVHTGSPGATQYAVNFSRDGSLLAVAGDKGNIELWNVTDPTAPVSAGPVLSTDGAAIFAMDFAPVGAVLAAADGEGTAHRWDLADPAAPKALPELAAPKEARSLAFSSSGLMAVGGDDGQVDLWRSTDAETPVGAVKQGSSVVTAATFSPDGHSLAVGTKAGAVLIWDISDPATPVDTKVELETFDSWVNTISYSADGKTLAAGSSDNSVKVWDLSTTGLRYTFQHSGPATGVHFLASGDLLTSSSDGTTRRWHLPGPVLTGAKDTIFSLSYTADSTTLFAGSASRTVGGQSWSFTDSGEARPLDPPSVPERKSMFGGGSGLSPDGRIIAAGAVDGSIQLWDNSNPAAPVAAGEPLKAQTNIIENVRFDAASTMMASSSDDSSIVLWDVRDLNAVTPLSTIPDIGGFVYNATFSRDGNLLAASSVDEKVVIWDISDPATPVELTQIKEFDGYVWAVAFSPDGRTLAVGGADRKVFLYNIADPRSPQRIGKPLAGPTNEIYWIDVSSNGRYLAAASLDGGLWLWDVGTADDPKLLSRLGASKGALFTAAFSPDGATLAAAGADALVHLWTTDPETVAENICEIQGTGITEAEWDRYLPDQPYAPPCG